MSLANLSILKTLKDYIQIFRDKGIKGVISKGGWRVVAYLVLFFLLKGVLFYVIIPYFIFKGFSG